MKIARFEYQHEIRQGVVDGTDVEVLALSGMARTGEVLKLSDVKLLAPVCPPNIIALGLNYQQHAVESKMKAPERPLMFLKATTSVANPGEPIVLPHMAPHEVDYEAELCIVIGKRAKNVSQDEAFDYVMGYTCGNDVSARDCQLRLDGQWARGKSFDTFCPLGPWIETDLDPADQRLVVRRDGEVVQDGHTSDMVHGIAALIAHASAAFTLLPGDVILTGTPAGVGPVQPGQRVEVEISDIGVLSNPFVRH